MREEFRVRLLTDAGEKFFGEGPYRLLRGVERLGSLRAAAGELGMAYSKANRIMSRAERLLGAPLTRRRIGGPDGGGSALTPLAQELLVRYEAFRADCEAAAKASFARNFGDLSLATETANGLPPTNPNHPSSASSLAAEVREQHVCESEGMVAERGAAGKHSARSSGDSLFVEETRKRRIGGAECTVEEREAAEAGDHSARSSGDFPFATKALERSTGESECAVAGKEVTAARDPSARNSGDFSEEGRAAGDTGYPSEAGSDCPSDDLSFAAEAQAQRTGEPENEVAVRGAATGGDHSARSFSDFSEAGRTTRDTSRLPKANSDCASGDSPHTEEARAWHAGKFERAITARGAATTGDRSARSSSDSVLAAKAQAQRTGESENAIVARGAATAEDHSARSFGDFSEEGRATRDTSRSPEAGSDCASGDSPHTKEARARHKVKFEHAVADQGAAAGNRSVRSSYDFFEAGSAAGDTCRSIEAGSDCPSDDLSLAAEAQAQRTGESENAIVARGAATAEDHSARSFGDFSEEGRATRDTSRLPKANSDCASGDSPHTEEARAWHKVKFEHAVADRGAAAGNRSARSPGDSSLAAEAQAQHTGEPENAVAAREAAAGKCFARSFGDILAPATGAANDADCLPQKKPNRPSGDSSLAADGQIQNSHESKRVTAIREAAARKPFRQPDESSSAAPGCSQTDSEHCERYAEKSALAVPEAAVRRASRSTGEASPAAPGCSRSAAEDCERYTGEHALAAREEVVRGASCCPSEASSFTLGCSRSAAKDCERYAEKSALAAWETASKEHSRFPSEASSAAPDCSRSAAEDCERYVGESILAAREATARGASCCLNEASPVAPGCSRTAAKDCERYAGKSAPETREMAARESSRFPGEAAPAALNCSRSAVKGCEQPASKSVLAAGETAAKEPFRFPDEAFPVAPGCSRTATKDCERYAGKSALAAREMAAHESSRFPGEAALTAPSYSRTDVEDCERHVGKSAPETREMAAHEPFRFPSEASPAALNCSRSAVKGCEQHAGKSVFAARETAAKEPFRFPDEAFPVAPGCSRTAAKDCERYAGKSALATREMAARESSRFPSEAPPVAPNRSRSAAEDCERHVGESVLAAAMQPAASESCRHSGEIPSELGCVVLAAGRARRFGGGKLLAELGGRPVLARTLEALPRGSFCRIAIVTSDPAVSALCREMGFPVREYPGGALSDSIREGLAEMDGTGGCMFVNGDQPLLRPDSLRRLASAFADDPARVYRLAHGGTAASPVVFPAPTYPALRALTGESGGMAALKSGRWEVRCVEAGEEAELWDVDDEDALRRMEEWLREKFAAMIAE